MNIDEVIKELRNARGNQEAIDTAIELLEVLPKGLQTREVQDGQSGAYSDTKYANEFRLPTDNKELAVMVAEKLFGGNLKEWYDDRMKIEATHSTPEHYFKGYRTLVRHNDKKTWTYTLVSPFTD